MTHDGETLFTHAETRNVMNRNEPVSRSLRKFQRNWFTKWLLKQVEKRSSQELGEVQHNVGGFSLGDRVTHKSFMRV